MSLAITLGAVAVSFRNTGGAGNLAWAQGVRRLRPGYVVLGVGNLLRGDDAVGCFVARELARRGLVRALDCGSVPENYLGRVVQLRPPDVLFVDAADFGEEPGTIAFFEGCRLTGQSVSTHSAGLRPVMEFIAASCGALCYVLAVQPAEVSYGAELSPPVRRAAQEIVNHSVWLERS